MQLKIKDIETDFNRLFKFELNVEYVGVTSIVTRDELQCMLEDLTVTLDMIKDREEKGIKKDV